MKQSTVLAIVLAVQSSHAQDQVGAPKNLTPQIVKNAVGLVKEGKRYSLARTLEIGIPTHPFHHPLFYATYRTIPESLKMLVVSLDSVYEIRTTRACVLYPPEARDTIHLRSAPSAPVVRGWRLAVRVSKGRNSLTRVRPSRR